ncbi:hypothetical protein GIB67_008688 [Kingdonia uniflora]|uniref:Uncharacterized protein n=1 Tax=Kingdonia uniflora TaxID=39325 RepID=A0A7J7M517_9MAGN|nr:hypothetical protein GIB67_008688 [Kingdonia uniflora]
MVETHSQRAVEARVLNDLYLAFKINEIREAVFGQQGYDVVLLEARANYEGGKDKRKAVTRSLDCKLREEAEIEEVLKKLQKLSKLVRTNAADSYSGNEGFIGPAFCKVNPLLQISMASISGCAKADEADLVGNLTPIIRVGDEEDIIAELIEWPRLKGARVEYPIAGRVWNDNLLWVSGECLYWSDEEPLELNNRTITKDFYVRINYKILRKESFIDVAAREDNELKAILKELEISRFKRVASKDDKVRRSQAKRRLAGKTPGSMEEKLSTPELNTPLKLVRLNEIPDGPVDMATVSNVVVQNLAKMKVLEESDKIADGADLRPRFEVEAGFLEEQCRAKAREKMVAVMDDEFKKDRLMELEKRISQLEGEINQLEESLTRERGDFQLEREKEREAATLKLKEVRAKSKAEAERLVTASAISQNNLAGKLYLLREDGLNVAEKTVVDNQETINQEIECSRLRVVDLEGLPEVEKKSSAKLQYEDRLDDNVKLSLKLEEAKRQVEEKTVTILSRDLVLNQLTSELAELKEKAASGS